MTKLCKSFRINEFYRGNSLKELIFEVIINEVDSLLECHGLPWYNKG